ncbi:N-acetylmuramoyl-L-alanine amidase [Dyella sp. C11]|uniref:N-acetylmuramoyl-L-alanine amidase n=1 Tax=Dyella sp. C11 TaxID=2126991 RepID=UPI000D657454|nr:N-acetylmuramoyl-L-alanine amidase [Dyella sp. C11]
MSDYILRHWTSATTSVGSTKDDAVEITVNNRAATRQAIIDSLAKKGYVVAERSAWGAKPNKPEAKSSHWDYTDIVLHHAGRSYSCSAGIQGAVEQMKRAQETDMSSSQHFEDIGYHYGISCAGDILEGRDVRLVGEHVSFGNTGKLGIVLLENLAVAGEGWTHEYSKKPLEKKARDTANIARDATAFNSQIAPVSQTRALQALVETLRTFFNINSLGGHREYQMLVGAGGRACPGRYGMDVVNWLRQVSGLSAP